MLDELGLTEVIATAPQQAPARRIVTAGHAVQAMGLHGLGGVHQQLDRVPHCLPHTPIARRIAPALPARHLNDDTLGRALETLYD